MFAILARHVALEENPPHVRIEPCGLGDRTEQHTRYVFPDQPTGHASLSAQRNDACDAIGCPITTFDAYVERQGLDVVNFVKVDIEGAEMLFLRGARRLFAQTVPPILVMENGPQYQPTFQPHAQRPPGIHPPRWNHQRVQRGTSGVVFLADLRRRTSFACPSRSLFTA